MILLHQAVCYLLMSLVVYLAASQQKELQSLARLLAIGSAACVNILHMAPLAANW